MINTKAGKAQRSAISRIGDTYGSLTVLDIVGKNSSGGAICSAKCVCGTEKEYELNTLVRGSTKSCGCLASSKRRAAESYIDETINNMTLIGVVGRDKRGAAIGRFRCGHCGSDHKEALLNSWKKNGLKSCGCQKPKKKTKPEDHIDIQYNHLTLLKITGKQGSHKTGLFHCANCGKEKDGIRISTVVHGKTKSCGCLHNKAEDAIGTTWGNLKLLEVTQKANGKGTYTKGIFECMLCGDHKEIVVKLVKGEIQVDCGCYKHHGYTNHKSFAVYLGMIDRCTNPLRKNYPRYGGRGIKVCDRWMEPNGQGLINFMEDIGDARPSMKRTLHRMWKYDKDGHVVEMLEYSKENCEWAPPSQQSIEKTEPRYRSRIEKVIKMAEEGYTIEEMADSLKTSLAKMEFYLGRCGLIKDYVYKQDGSVIKKAKKVENKL